MKIVISFLLYLLAGFIEMFLITQRTSYIARNKRKHAALVVLLENTITFFVILQLAKDVTDNLPDFAAYCIGSCAGTILDFESLLSEKILRKTKKLLTI